MSQARASNNDYTSTLDATAGNYDYKSIPEATAGKYNYSSIPEAQQVTMTAITYQNPKHVTMTTILYQKPQQATMNRNSISVTETRAGNHGYNCISEAGSYERKQYCHIKRAAREHEYE
jgi:plastocyanin